MDIRKIALYLSGKIPPEYNKINRLEFMESLKEIFWYWYDALDFYWKQAKEYEEEFYFMVLDLLHTKSLKNKDEKIKFDKLLNDLSLTEIEQERLHLEQYKDEEEFTTKFLLKFFKKLWYIDVRYNHWADEKGKDIVMKKINDLWEYKYIWVQAKKWDIDTKAANKVWLTTIITQAKKAFENDYDDVETSKKVRISEYFIATNWKITEKAVDEIMNIEPTYLKNNIHFLDKIKIENLLEEIN